jgi:hypothetical protein
MGDDSASGAQPADGSGGLGDGASSAGGGSAEVGGAPGAGGRSSGGSDSILGGAPAAGGDDGEAVGGEAAGGAAVGGAESSGGSPGDEPVFGDPDFFLGRIQLTRGLAQVTNSNSISVQFVLEDPSTSLEVCEIEVFGDCTITTCTDPDEASNALRLSAGEVTLTSDFEFAATGVPSPTGLYYTFEDTDLIQGGEVVTFSFAGDAVPAFSGTMVVPLAPLLLSPAAVGTGQVEVLMPRGGSFTFTWDAREASQAVILLSAFGHFDVGWRMGCRFDAAAGTGTVPAEAMARLEPGMVLLPMGSNRDDLQLDQGTFRKDASFAMVSEDRAAFPRFVAE